MTFDHELRSSAEKWLRDYVAGFRAAAAELSPEERTRVSNLEDFGGPCQVHLFWFRADPNVDYALLVCSRLKNVPDELVDVVGPIHPPIAQAVLEKALQEDLWSEEIEDRHLLHGEDRTARHYLAAALRGALTKLDQHILRSTYSAEPAQPSIPTRRWFPGGGFTWDVYGDIRSVDSTEQIHRVINEARRKRAPTVRAPSPESTEIRGFGTYFYPELWVGDLPLQSPEDILKGTIPSGLILPPKAFDTDYRDKKIVVSRDGFIAVEADDKSVAAEMINEIMASVWLSGVEATAVRELELGTVQIALAGMTIKSITQELVSIRTSQGFRAFENRVPESVTMLRLTRAIVTEEGLKKAIARAQVATADGHTKNMLMFLLEAHTHLEISEYRQAVIMAWLVVESWLEREWSNMLAERKVPSRRSETLKASTVFTAHVRTEVLELLGAIPPEDYGRISKTRKLRNDVVHKGYKPTYQDAQQGLRLAIDIAHRIPAIATLATL